MKSVGVRVEYGEQLEEAVLKGTFKTVGDKEHAEIIRLYSEDALNIEAIARAIINPSFL